jgi:hypothetical protein
MRNMTGKALLYRVFFVSLAAFTLFLAYKALMTGIFHAGVTYGREDSPIGYWLYLVGSVLFAVLVLATQIFGSGPRQPAQGLGRATQAKKKASHLKVVASNDLHRHDPDKPTIH